MFIPEGMTEDEVVQIMTRISNLYKRKYKFGYNSEEDVVQQGILHAIKNLNNGKFKPRGNKPMALQLTNFLRVWVDRRLNNDRRNQSCRYSRADTILNKTKFAIMHPLKIHSQGLESSEIFARDSGAIDSLMNDDIKEKVLEGLDIDQRKDYMKLLGGVRISQQKEDELFARIKQILAPREEDDCE